MEANAPAIADPKADIAYSQLAQILLHTGQIERSLDYFNKAIDLTRTEAELVMAISFRLAAQAKHNVIQRYPSIGELFHEMQKKLQSQAAPLR
jgi:import receptor subunit TOM70